MSPESSILQSRAVQSTTPGDPTAADPDSLRIAILVYRGNPHSGGQGVYTRYLARELLEMGHRPTVFSGQPWPLLDEGVELVKVPSLDLYRQPDPFRIPWPNEFHSRIDLGEFLLMCSAAFPEPWSFSHRVRRELAARKGQFDVIHDNQCLGSGMLGIMEDGWPLLTTLHHPITVDFQLELDHARTRRKRFNHHRWYSFLKAQMRVIPKLPRIVTVSTSSERDIIGQMGATPEQMHVVHVGVDHTIFKPMPEVPRVPGRIVCTSSSDMPLKGVIPLLEAIAKLRTEREDLELVVIGRPKRDSPVTATIERLGLADCVRFVHGVPTEDIVRLYAECSVAVVPSLYEGFSLPAIEAMACGVALVATTGGALPEVVGTSGETGILVPPNDPSAMAQALGSVLESEDLRRRLGEAGRARVLKEFTWRVCAEGTVEHYLWTIEHKARRSTANRI